MWLPQIKEELQYTTVFNTITHQSNPFHWKEYLRTLDGATMDMCTDWGMGS